MWKFSFIEILLCDRRGNERANRKKYAVIPHSIR